jgi:Spy/CpxP family protein refolding chaperone
MMTTDFVNTFRPENVSQGVTKPHTVGAYLTTAVAVAACWVAFQAPSGLAAGPGVVPGPQGAAQGQGAPQTGAGRQMGPNPGGGWWNDAEIKKELRLTEEQTKRIRDMFEKREAEVKPLWAKLNREGSRLDTMTRERAIDEATYAVQVNLVETLYARLRESRTVMVYRMYRELQPDQYKKLEEILDRRRSRDGAGRGSGIR